MLETCVSGETGASFRGSAGASVLTWLTAYSCNELIKEREKREREGERERCSERRESEKGFV